MTGSNPAALREAHGVLRASGKRITSQRALLLQIIQESGAHLDAEELYRRAKRRDPRLNLTTVYRALNLFKESRLIEPSYLTHDHRRERFESKPAAEHYHFTCRRCGKVIEFESPLIEQLRREVKLKFGVEFTHGCLCFEGYCADCAQKRKS
jgi:Fe2+ or Zn2+ uptake regulation protein